MYKIIVIYVFALLGISAAAYSSQLFPQTLDEIVEQGIFNRRTLLVVARVKQITMDISNDRATVRYDVEGARILQGNSSIPIEVMEYHQIVPVIRDSQGKITGSFSPILPCSGKEYSIEKGKEYIFFSNTEKSSSGSLNVFRVEPIKNQSKVVNSLNSLFESGRWARFPGGLSCKVSINAATFSIEQKATIDVILMNASDKDVMALGTYYQIDSKYGPMFRAGVEPTLEDEKGNIIKPKHDNRFKSSESGVVFPPGKQIGFGFFVDDLYEIKKPGKYSFHISFQKEFPGLGKGNSNRITFIVK